ncbi:OLC1v1015396C1 [Oldenlandia corymbosa var. corymbosa]|uniref:OLC1v1015396C1 n=1 Tax=Oldenlandia corymbosa var. corymbosa TaxID=529605 RepID=A0AAV1E5C6_OLDCO|nr:OLC1v1015396C1 [Oldenlandia corymbosa var. corymbosa]
MEDPAEMVAVQDLRPMPPASSVRRRLVQSTLFPINKKDQICKNGDYKGEGEHGGAYKEEGEEEDDDAEEEWDCNSKKRTRNSSARKKKKKANNSNSKTTPRSRATKKVAVNPGDVPSLKVDEGDSPVIRSNSQLQNSLEGNQKIQENDDVPVVLLEENSESCSPNSPANKRTPRKPKQKANSLVEEKKKTKTTPKKKVVNGPQKGPDEPAPQLIPNLRLEAKKSAEENSRLFAGKQIHPFFSSMKSIKRNQEIIDLENSCCSVETKEPSLVFNPIHVFDHAEDDALSLDWGNWVFYDRDSLNNQYDLGFVSLSAYEGHVSSLQFDEISTVGLPTSVNACQREISLVECDTLHKDCGVERNEASTSGVSCCDKWQGGYIEQIYGEQQANCLWTDKFRPRKAAQICGNSDSVKFLTDWLCMWHEKSSQVGKSSFYDDSAVDQDDDCFSYPSDSDSENFNDETSLNNVLLVTGPVGSGKSAAIYACAEEQGFQVIEVNTSDWRNGALVKQRFGEALESHWLQRKVNIKENSEKEPPSKFFPGMSRGSEIEVVEIPPSDEDNQQNSEMSCKSTFGVDKIQETQNVMKTLILFEDIDIVLVEDHGFLSTIKQLARTAKRPMILTANSKNPALPSNLKRLEVSFETPSSKELLELGHVVCETEKAKVPPWLIDRFVKCCKGDIRKTIMLLQFWCQGQSLKKGDRLQITYRPLPFELQAGHAILPKLIPWGCTSQLSEIIEEEITKSLTMMEEHKGLMEIVVEQELVDGRSHGTPTFRDETYWIDAKKEAMLSFHCSVQSEGVILASPDYRCQTSNISGSPVTVFRRNVRRKLETVISSDSEEDHLGDSSPANFVGASFDDSYTMQDMKTIYSPHKFTIGRCCVQTDHLTHSEKAGVEQTFTECSENVTHPQSNGFCTSMGISCVPESSFVPETEVDDKTEVFSAEVSCSLLHKEEGNSTCRGALTNSFLVENDILFTPFLDNHEKLGNCSNVDGAMFHKEEVGDSHLECVEEGVRQHPMLDECSRIDSIGVKNLERLRSHGQIESIDETWKRLRDCTMDFRRYVTLEEKDVLQGLEVVSGMSNLISEADLLLSSCEPQICDSVEPSLLPSESSQLCSWYEDHLHMSSTMAQHGICFYAKRTVALGLRRGLLDRVDLAQEMLSSSTSNMALGKLLSVESKVAKDMEVPSRINSSSLRREMDLSIGNILQSLVSTRSHLSLRGDAFHDYLSSLSKISRLESMRLSEQASAEKKRRYVRCLFAVTRQILSFCRCS